MWVYTTQGIAQNVWNTSDPGSRAYNEAGNWTGVIFAACSVFAALYSLVLTKLADKFGRKIYMFSLVLGGIGLSQPCSSPTKHVICSYDRRWHCMGSHSCNALCHPFINTSCKANRRIYGHIQRNNYYTPNRGWLTWRSCINSCGRKTINVVGIAGASMVLAGIFAKLVIKTKE